MWPSDELYHIWAHQKAARGRAAGVNVYFTGQVIYSYGDHFPMARLLLKNGKPVAVLLTTRTYSVTTSSHQSSVRAAVRHLKCFYVNDVLYGVKHSERLKDFAERIKSEVATVLKARSAKSRCIRDLDGVINQANEYAEWFGLKTRFTYPKDFDRKAELAKGVEEDKKSEERAKKRDERNAAQRAAQQENARARYRKEMAEYGPALEAWLNGASSTASFPSTPHDPDGDWSQRLRDETRLRVRGSRIETSKGAVFDIEQAKPILMIARLNGEGVIARPDMEVSGYRGVTVNFIAKTVSVGCHVVAFAEVERIAKQLNL